MSSSHSPPGFCPRPKSYPSGAADLLLRVPTAQMTLVRLAFHSKWPLRLRPALGCLHWGLLILIGHSAASSPRLLAYMDRRGSVSLWPPFLWTGKGQCLPPEEDRCQWAVLSPCCPLFGGRPAEGICEGPPPYSQALLHLKEPTQRGSVFPFLPSASPSALGSSGALGAGRAWRVCFVFVQDHSNHSPPGSKGKPQGVWGWVLERSPHR